MPSSEMVSLYCVVNYISGSSVRHIAWFESEDEAADYKVEHGGTLYEVPACWQRHAEDE